jgi:hypothetical protein
VALALRKYVFYIGYVVSGPQAGGLAAAVSLYIVIIVTKRVSQFFDSRKKNEKSLALLFLENGYVPFFESETVKRV